MKAVIGSLALALILTACASGPEQARTKALYSKYDAHCREHAREVTAEADYETRYRECMDYFVSTDVHCPYCVPDPDLTK